MLNYIKSEFYRITHLTAIYVTALVFAALPLILNFILFALESYIPNYLYATTTFSFSNLVAMPMIFCYAAFIIVYILYDGNKKDGNLKNAIAFGITREKIFIGQLIVSFVSCVVILAVTEAVYVLSAILLLRNEGPITTMDMLHEVVAVLPISIAALILGIVVIQLFDKSVTGAVVWGCVMCFVPKVLFLLGLELEAIQGLAMWLPENFFSIMQVNQSVCEPIWNTPEGFAKCLIAGFAGILIFGFIGIFSFRKREL